MAQPTPASISTGPAPETSSGNGKIDQELVALATRTLLKVPPNDGDHTVAAAARARTGAMFAGINVFHFTGGPCAELVALGVAAAQGVLAPDLVAMVAVRRDRANDDTSVTVLNPCGRCRQVLLDYNPKIHVIVRDHKDALAQVRVADALPFAYVYGDDDDVADAGESGGAKEDGEMISEVTVALV